MTSTLNDKLTRIKGILTDDRPSKEDLIRRCIESRLNSGLKRYNEQLDILVDRINKKDDLKVLRGYSKL